MQWHILRQRLERESLKFARKTDKRALSGNSGNMLGSPTCGSISVANSKPWRMRNGRSCEPSLEQTAVYVRTVATTRT
jgi:hypothetical protein